MTTPIAGRTNPSHHQACNDTNTATLASPLYFITPDNTSRQPSLDSQQTCVDMRKPSPKNCSINLKAIISLLENTTTLPQKIKSEAKQKDWKDNIPFFISCLKEQEIPLTIARSTIDKKLIMICAKNKNGLASLQKLWSDCKNKGLTPQFR